MIFYQLFRELNKLFIKVYKFKKLININLYKYLNNQIIQIKKN